MNQRTPAFLMTENPIMAVLNSIFNAILVWLKGLTTQDILAIIVPVGVILFSYLRRLHNTPRLIFDGFWVIPHTQTALYCLKITSIGGEGRAEGCEGFLTVNGKLDLHPTTFLPPTRTPIDISTYGYLALFQIENDSIPIIHFPDGNFDVRELFFSRMRYPFTEYEQLTLSVHIVYKKARMRKKDFEERIDKIISVAKPIPNS